MTFEEFDNLIKTNLQHKPQNWRKGQFVFNFIDANFNVARAVQFQDHIDCFYNDSQIDNFIQAAYKRCNYQN
jgi:hypothetical protein